MRAEKEALYPLVGRSWFRSTRSWSDAREDPLLFVQGKMPLLQGPKDAGIAAEAEGNRFQHRLHTLPFGLGERS